MLFFYPRDVLDEIWDLIESVSEGFPSYSYTAVYRLLFDPLCSYQHALFVKLSVLIIILDIIVILWFVCLYEEIIQEWSGLSVLYHPCQCRHFPQLLLCCFTSTVNI